MEQNTESSGVTVSAHHLPVEQQNNTIRHTYMYIIMDVTVMEYSVYSNCPNDLL